MGVVRLYNFCLGYGIFFINTIGCIVIIVGFPLASLKDKLQKEGYSDRMIEELWKWNNPSSKKGVASF